MSGRENHIAVGRIDDAAVLDLRRHQDDAAPGWGGDGAAIDKAARGDRSSREVEPPGKEILVAHVERGGHQSGDIDARALAKEHAAGIDQEDFAIGLQGAQDHRGIDAGYAVEHRARCALLDEACGLGGANGEAVPVDYGVRAVGDGEAIALLSNRDLAVDDRRARGIGVHHAAECGGHGKTNQPMLEVRALITHSFLALHRLILRLKLAKIPKWHHVKQYVRTGYQGREYSPSLETNSP